MPGAATQLSLFSEGEEPDSVSGFSVRESSRARRLSIKVFPRGRVEVVVPRRTRPGAVREFVEALDIPREAKDELLALTPAGYTGNAGR